MTLEFRTPVGESREPLERLLGLLATEASGNPPPRIQLGGGHDELPMWLADRDWRIFARPSRELVSGGQEIAQFQLPSEAPSAWSAARSFSLPPTQPAYT